MASRSSSVCFIEKCPRCLKTAEFSYAVGRLGFFGKKTILRVTCTSCSTIFQNEDHEEGAKLLQIAELHQQITNSGLSVEEAMDRMKGVGSRILGEIQEGSKTWTCDQCGEENFDSVGECWVCQSEHPEMKDLEPDEQDDDNS